MEKLNDLRIWVAEDDDEFGEILSNALAHEQREVRLFKDGRQVLAAIPRDPFDILIADLIMPGADGIQILNEVKKFDPDKLVVIMTGYASVDSAIDAIRGGAYDYIRKPFKLEELEIVIKNGAEKISLMRENRYLLHRLKETMEKMDDLKKKWEEHLVDISGLYSLVDRSPKTSEMELILNQLNPAPPDHDIREGDFSGKYLSVLEKLVRFRKEGFIDAGEFAAFKKKLLKVDT